MKKLTKKEMKENLGLTKDEINLIWNYQETFTQFWDDECTGFCVDGRLLYSELGYSDEGNYNRWIKNFIELLEKELNKDFNVFFNEVVRNGYISKFTENEIKAMSSQQRSRNKISTEYNLTLAFANEICLTVGVLPKTNKNTKVLSSKVRKYFILMEKIVHNYEKWQSIRKDEKKGYNILKKALEEKAKREGKRLTMTDYCEEANLINGALFGYTSLEMKRWFNKDTAIRDSFSTEENTCIDELQRADITLMDMGFDFKIRKDKLKEMVKNKNWNHIRIPYDDILEKIATGGNNDEI